MKQPTRYFAIAAVLCLMTHFAAAEQWNRFRGPNGSGTVENARIPLQWSVSNMSWRTTLPGIGHSSPVLWGDKLFVQSADVDRASQHLLCLDAKSGEILWKQSHPFKTYRIHRRNSYATVTPGVDADHVYFAWSSAGDTTLMAMTHDGREVWQVPLGPYIGRHGFSSSPVPLGDAVIIANQQLDSKSHAEDYTGPLGKSFLAAFERTTGQLKWKAPQQSGSASFSVPCVYEGEDGVTQIICCNTISGMFGLAASTGKPLWNVPVFSKRTVSSPVIAGNVIVGTTGSGGGGNYVVGVRLGGSPAEAYRIKTKAPYVPTPVVKDDLLFLISDRGVASCVEAETGKVLWSDRAGSEFSASPIRVGDQIICVSDEGQVIILTASRRFKILGKNTLGAPTRATPAVGPGGIYFRTYSQIMCLPLDT